MQRFNSLGSNYPFRLAVKFALAKTDGDDRRALISVLSLKYGGRTRLFFKNREALRAGLELLRLPRKAGVLITGFTCYVVYKAVIDAGLVPVLVDINPDSLNPDVDAVLKALESHPYVRAVIIQNTFGFPFDIHAITSAAGKKKVYLIEDLAHSAGGSYRGGTEMGTVGDLTILSFSQDKILDAVSGGALVIRNQAVTNAELPYARLPRGELFRERFYPVITNLIRHTYPFPGKILHRIAKNTHLLSTPMGPRDPYPYHPFPDRNLKLALRTIRHNQTDLQSRRIIARIYIKYLPEAILFPECVKSLDHATVIRFPVKVYHRKKLLDFLTARGIHLTDIWYDAPVAPKRYFALTQYTGECPVAERVAEMIVNLPTHREITAQDAKKIASLITLWYTKITK